MGGLAGYGQVRTGTGDLGSVFIVALVSIVVVVPLLLLFPGAANLRGLPGPSQWYLYIGGAIGLADAATLAARFDIDIRTPDFWRASLDLVRADIDRFERLVGA